MSREEECWTSVPTIEKDDWHIEERCLGYCDEDARRNDGDHLSPLLEAAGKNWTNPLLSDLDLKLS